MSTERTKQERQKIEQEKPSTPHRQKVVQNRRIKSGVEVCVGPGMSQVATGDGVMILSDPSSRPERKKSIILRKLEDPLYL